MAALLELRIVGRDHSAFARRHRFARLKAETPEVPPRARSAFAPSCSGNVRAILDNCYRVLAPYLGQGVEVRQRGAVVHRDDRLGARGDELLGTMRIDAGGG